MLLCMYTLVYRRACMYMYVCIYTYLCMYMHVHAYVYACVNEYYEVNVPDIRLESKVRSVAKRRRDEQPRVDAN